MVLTRSRSKSSETDASEASVKTTPIKNNTHKESKAKAKQNGTPSKTEKIEAQNEKKSPIKKQSAEENSENAQEVSMNSEESVKVKNNKNKEKSNKANGDAAPETLSSLTDKILSNPLNLTTPKSNTSKDPHLQLMTKVLDLGKLTQFGQDGPFEQIRMKGLNMEQIWGQMNLKNNAFLDRAGNAIKGWYGDDAMDIDDEMDMDDEDDLMDEELDDEDEEDEEEDDDDEEDEEEEEDGEEEDEFEDEEEFQGFGDEEEEEEEEIDQDDEAETLSAPKRTYEVDDEFFSLEKMEEFVQEAERNEMKEDEDEEEEDDDEDDVDLFADPDELDDSDADVDVNDIKFGDFFLPNSKKTTSRSKLSFKKGVDDQDLEENDDQMDVDEEEPELEDEDLEEDQDSAFKVKKTSNLFDDDDDIMVDEDGEPLSNFEKKQAQMNEIIHDLEMENLDDRTWTMKGEATSKDRPLNSLLEEDLEFDYASKPAPLITEEVTQDLEDLIKKRIIENQFNDVEKKVAPKVREFQPREQLDQEKSLKSLGEVYEDEYQSQVAGLPAKQQEKLSKAHQDIEELFNNVMNKLTSLSNFHYTPKAPQLKVQVVENVGAIQMEEALPTAVSDAQTLAPEEVYEKSRGEIKSTEEMDSEEKRRLRNRKKRLAKLRSKDKPDPKDKVDPMIANLPKV